MAIYRSKETIEAEQYDGSPASVERIMSMLGRTTGIMNTSEGYMLIGGVQIPKSWFVVKSNIRPWGYMEEWAFDMKYEKLDQ